MSDDAVAEIKARLDIVDVVGAYVPLRKTGRSYLGLCPFHGEKTPSFHVSPERQTYHCFGCGKGGDIFSFLMEIEGLSFPEALEQLARRAGVVLRRKAEERRTGLRDVLDEALLFFRRALNLPLGEIGRSYLARRQVSRTHAETFELGWTPRTWDALARHLEGGNFPSKLLEASGLVMAGKKGFYDRFRGRIIFPIRDLTGKLIAFGGRLVDGEGAKYINSPENELYSKRRSLYLIDRARRVAMERGRTILVEGYMDALRLHAEGFTEAVASLGTALTEEQAGLLKRLSDRCYICYDSDLSGKEATLKGMYILQRSGLDVHVVTLPTGKDPDDLLLQPGGKEAFERALDEARPLLAHHIALRAEAFRDRRRRRGAIEELIEGLLSLPLLDIAPFLPEIASAMDVFPRQLQQILDERRKGLSLSLSVDGRGQRPEEGKGGFPCVSVGEGKEESFRDPWEEILCWLLWSDGRLRSEADASVVLPLLKDPVACSVACALLAGETPEELSTRWLETEEKKAPALLAAGGDRCERLPRDRSRWDLALQGLTEVRLRGEYDAIRARMVAGEATAEEMSRYREIAGKLKGGRATS